MKYIIWLFFIASLASMIFGFTTDFVYSQKFIGFGVVALFIIVFPMFSYYRWKGKNVKDYMLTKENLDKMRAFNEKEK